MKAGDKGAGFKWQEKGRGSTTGESPAPQIAAGKALTETTHTYKVLVLDKDQNKGHHKDRRKGILLAPRDVRVR